MIFDHTAFNRATVWRLEFETAQCGRSVLSTLKFWSLHGNLIGIEAIIEICFITNELTIVLIQLSYDYVNCAMHKAPTGTFNSIFTQKFCCFITVTMCLDLRTMIVRTSIKYFWIIAQWEKNSYITVFQPLMISNAWSWCAFSSWVLSPDNKWENTSVFLSVSRMLLSWLKTL